MDSMIHWLGEQCRAAPLAEKWLLAEDMRVAQQWKDRLNLAGCATINLHSRTLANITASLASFPLAEQHLKVAGHGTTQILIQTALCQLQSDGRLKYFQTVRSIAGLSQLVAASIRDLRLAPVDAEMMPESAFESSEKAGDVLLIYRAYCDLLKQHGVIDYGDCIRLAVTGIEDGSIKLPSDLRVLMPEKLDCLPVERRLLQALGNHATVEHCERIDPQCDTTNRLTELVAAGRGEFSFNSGFGEANEVRGAFQDILSDCKGGQKRLDQVEILHTDCQLYVPLILEQIAVWMTDQGEDGSSILGLDELPVTFAEGIACVNSRPARALRAWLGWSQNGCSQTRVVPLIREGLLRREDPAAEMGYSRIAHVLRKLPIGFGADRYLPQIEHATKTVNKELAARKEDNETKDGGGDTSRHEFELRGLQAVRSMVEPLVKFAPREDDSSIEVLGKAKRFLSQCSRVETKLDSAGLAALLDDIDAMLGNLVYAADTEFDALAWLQELPSVIRIFASGPQPGRVHVAPLSRGGHSGRREVYVLGLDDGKFPRRMPVDPIVLDAERRRLSAGLKTSGSVSEKAGRALERALIRVLAEPGGRVNLSYSMRDLVDDRPQFPSPCMLDLFRITENNERAHMDDLLKHLASPVSFVSVNADKQLSRTDSQLSTLLSGLEQDEKEEFLNAQIGYRTSQQRAIAAGKDPNLTSYDGWVPRAGNDLDPTKSQVVSPSRLETFGICPRRFFFKYGLNVRPPDEYSVDTEQWLDALQLGSLVHALFEDFLRDLTTRDETPEFQRDRQPLLQRLQGELDKLECVIPIPNEDCYRRTSARLRETCEIFLAKEEEYCREFNARPWVLEASIGIRGKPTNELATVDPVPLALTDGRVLQVCGVVDRVDRLMTGGSETYAIWDYKSGSSYGFSKEDPFKQGRKLQPYLYVGMLRHRIKQRGGDEHAVNSFGYFFPSPRTEGLRLQWTHAELTSGDDVLRWISDLIRDGVFVATTDPSDCAYCDYLAVCGDPDVVTSIASLKSAQGSNVVLEPWRSLRGISTDGEAQ